MFPIRDTIQSRTVPVVNNLIIGVNILVFLVQLSLGTGASQFVTHYGLTPARYTVPEIAAYFSLSQQAFSFFSYMFLHGGFLHLLGNMWMLYIFGDNVEDRLGHFRYLAFFLACGVLAGAAHMVSAPYSKLPTVGASGAIAGVMGAYFLLHPRAKVLTLIPIIIIPFFVEIPAFFFLGFWFVMQFLNAAGSASGGIAWWAHVGGFIFGMILVRLIPMAPQIGADRMVRSVTKRRRSPRLQVLRPSGAPAVADMTATLFVTPTEARLGAKKIVNIPWGYEKRLFTVVVPPGVRPGTKLRLKGLGKSGPGGERGDIYLEVALTREA
ncbi:MAG: rhomboid family intramembrane serine protease [Desulfatibacillum sp.]|nr:rhomboid family intramembrane serine protease [Desulfatibacillum sp.]